MIKYLIDENLPYYFPIGNSENFIHVSHLESIGMDPDIWQYALLNKLIILTKDSDFFYRFLSTKNCPNLEKKDFSLLLQTIWDAVKEMLLSCSFIIITEEKIQGF